MTTPESEKLYLKLQKLRVWPAAGLLIILVVFGAGMIYVSENIFFDNFLGFISERASAEVVSYVQVVLSKNMMLWLFFLGFSIFINLILIYILWTIRRYIRELDMSR